MKPHPTPSPAEGEAVLLHACCAPCSSAIVEWMLANGIRPTIFYFNPNIWPRREYDIRKEESKRHAESLGLQWGDGDYDHGAWLEGICGLEGEPERGRRCEQCFTLRLTATARKARALGIRWFATTLASSRWKRLEQIEQAGRQAEAAVPGTSFWAQNWRKGGLQERRNQLLREYGFYNQQYCGCEFSVRPDCLSTMKDELRTLMREAKQQHCRQLPQLSAAVRNWLRPRLAGSQLVMAYWPLADEVDIRPLLDELAAGGKTILLPKVLDGESMQLHTYTTRADLAEGAFHIMEPTGAPFTDHARIDTALVPGMAFDAAGRRLGRGRGYYDRFLAGCPQVRKIGVCFPFQLVDEVPAEAHDVRMDEVCPNLP